MVREGKWREGRPALLQIPRLMGQTLGLVSFGHVARAVAKRAKPFGLRILAYDPFIEELVMVEHGVIPSTLEEVLSQSDFVSMHAPARPEVEGMLGEKHFRLMKKTAIFINTGRGPTVQEVALIKALEEKWIAYAGLDVLEIEPPGDNNPMLKMDNVILSAHTRVRVGAFRSGTQAACRARAGAGAGGQVADELRQSGGAAEHQTAPLAAGVHGTRPQQLTRRCKAPSPLAGRGAALNGCLYPRPPARTAMGAPVRHSTRKKFDADARGCTQNTQMDQCGL